MEFTEQASSYGQLSEEKGDFECYHFLSLMECLGIQEWFGLQLDQSPITEPHQQRWLTLSSPDYMRGGSIGAWLCVEIGRFGNMECFRNFENNFGYKYFVFSLQYGCVVNGNMECFRDYGRVRVFLLLHHILCINWCAFSYNIFYVYLLFNHLRP